MDQLNEIEVDNQNLDNSNRPSGNFFNEVLIQSMQSSDLDPEIYEFAITTLSNVQTKSEFDELHLSEMLRQIEKCTQYKSRIRTDNLDYPNFNEVDPYPDDNNQQSNNISAESENQLRYGSGLDPNSIQFGKETLSNQRTEEEFGNHQFTEMIRQFERYAQYMPGIGAGNISNTAYVEDPPLRHLSIRQRTNSDPDSFQFGVETLSSQRTEEEEFGNHQFPEMIRQFERYAQYMPGIGTGNISNTAYVEDSPLRHLSIRQRTNSHPDSFQFGIETLSNQRTEEEFGNHQFPEMIRQFERYAQYMPGIETGNISNTHTTYVEDPPLCHLPILQRNNPESIVPNVFSGEHSMHGRHEIQEEERLFPGNSDNMPKTIGLSGHSSHMTISGSKTASKFQFLSNQTSNQNIVSTLTSNQAQDYRIGAGSNRISNEKDKETGGNKQKTVYNSPNSKRILSGTEYSEKNGQFVTLAKNISKESVAYPTNAANCFSNRYPNLKHLLSLPTNHQKQINDGSLKHLLSLPSNHQKQINDGLLHLESTKEGENSKNVFLDNLTKIHEQNVQLNKSGSLTIEEPLAKIVSSEEAEHFSSNITAEVSGIVRRRRRNHVCQVCREHFQNKELLREHSKIHSYPKPLECKICLKMYKYKKLFLKHMKLHSDGRNFSCAHCEHTFVSEYDLKLHEQTHLITRRFICTVCSKIFKIRRYFELHMLTHTRSKNRLECAICGRIFSIRTYLMKHLLHHAVV